MSESYNGEGSQEREVIFRETYVYIGADNQRTTETIEYPAPKEDIARFSEKFGIGGDVRNILFTESWDSVIPSIYDRMPDSVNLDELNYLTGSLNVFNHRTNVDIGNRLVCFDIKELGKGLKKIAMLILQDAVWNRVTINRAAKKTTWFYIDEMHLLLKEEQTAAYTVEIWKRFRKWGGVPSGLTQNVKDLLASREIENIFENSDFIYMLNQAAGDRQILAKQLGISPYQLSYVTHSNAGEGLMFYGDVIIPFIDRFPKDTEIYALLNTRPAESVVE